MLGIDNVFVVEGPRLHREALVSFLSSQKGIEVLASAAYLEEAWERVPRSQSIVVVLDLAGPLDTNLLRSFIEVTPFSSIIGVSIADDDAGSVIAWAEAGIAGYVSAEESLEDLVRLIRSLPKGESPCSPRISAALFSRMASRVGQPCSGLGDSNLTSREKQVAGLVARGLTNKEISKALFIALPTVKNHVHNVLEKTHLSRRTDLIKLRFTADRRPQ